MHDDLAPPGRLRATIGLPLRLVLSKYFAIVALDDLLTIHTLPTSRPDVRAGVGVVMTPLEPLSVILRHEKEALQLHLDAVDHWTSLALQVSLRHLGDVGLSYSARRRHHGVVLEFAGSATDQPLRWDAFMQLYVQKRF